MSIHYWQHYVGSLTAELERVSGGQLQFSFLEAGEKVLSLSEANALQCSLLTKAWVREVAWHHKKVVHVIAKAIIPKTDSKAYRTLREWDDSPLGHLLYQHNMDEQLPWLLSPDQGYVLHRRRLLSFDGHPILLSEQMTQSLIDTWELA